MCGIIDGVNNPRQNITLGVEDIYDKPMSEIWFQTATNDDLPH